MNKRIYLPSPHMCGKELKFIADISNTSLGQSHLEIVQYMLRLIPTFKPRMNNLEGEKLAKDR